MKKIVLAFDSFKGCMTANEACDAASIAINKQYRDAEIVCLPMSDGGEGLVSCITNVIKCDIVSVPVHDPLMRNIVANYAISYDGTTAYMEMAAAAGITLLTEEERNPMITTTYGVGEMILDAARRGCRDIIMGIGGSATCDGGKGMIDFLQPHLPLNINITIASDVNNPLYGHNGAAHVFAPQKGATAEQVLLLDKRLREFEAIAISKGIAHPSLSLSPGAGAAGGLGYGLMAYLGANLVSGIDFLLDAINFDREIKDADLIITGEGKSDRQTLMGKVPYGILTRAKLHNVPVALLSGAIEDEKSLLEAGFRYVDSINDGVRRPLHELMRKECATQNLSICVANTLNTFFG